MQSKAMSFAEALINIFVGVFVSFTSQVFIFQAYGIHVTLAQNAEMTCFFTLISLVRSYALRRYFNSLRVQK